MTFINANVATLQRGLRCHCFPGIVTHREIIGRSSARPDTENCKPLMQDRCHREAQAYNAHFNGLRNGL
jgi:hypothetical protein